jgi:hypothetical protein
MRQQAPGRDQGPLKGDQTTPAKLGRGRHPRSRLLPMPTDHLVRALIDRVRRWGKENVGDVMSGSGFDVVIVGGGTAGCILANRLRGRRPGSLVGPANPAAAGDGFPDRESQFRLVLRVRARAWPRVAAVVSPARQGARRLQHHQRNALRARSRGGQDRIHGRRDLARPRPHIPMLMAGGGEKLTLRLVARYADICNGTEAAQVRRVPEALRRRRPGLRVDDEVRHETELEPCGPIIGNGDAS